MNLLRTKALPLLLSVFILAPADSHAGPEDDPEFIYQVAVTAVALVVGVAGALYCMCVKANRTPPRTLNEDQGVEPHGTWVFASAGGIFLPFGPNREPLRIEERVLSDDEGDAPLETTPEVSAALRQHVQGLQEVVNALAEVAYELKLDPRNRGELEALVKGIADFDILNQPIEVLGYRLVELTKFIVPTIEVAPPGKLQKKLLDAAKALALALSTLAAEIGNDESGFKSSALALRVKVKESCQKARDLRRDQEHARRQEEVQRKRVLEEELSRQRQVVARRQELQEEAAKEQQRAALRSQEIAEQRLREEERAKQERLRQIHEATAREERLNAQEAERSAREAAEARLREEQRREAVPTRVGYGVTLEDLQAAKAKREKK